MSRRIGAAVGFLIWVLTLFGLFLPPWIGWGLGAALATWFSLRLILFLEHDAVLVFGALMAVSAGAGSWAKGVWEKSGAILSPPFMGRIVLILTAVLAVIVTIYYVRAVDTYRRSRANLTKERLVVEEEPDIARLAAGLVRRLIRRDQAEKPGEIVLILGERVENRNELKKREIAR